MDDLEKITDNDIKNSKISKKVLKTFSRYFNYKTALGGAVFMGTLIFGINYFGSDDLHGSTIAALKQAGYSGISGGFLIKMSKYFALKYKNKALSLTSAIILPVLTTTLLTYGIHKYYKESPKPIASTAPATLIISLLAPPYASYVRRKDSELKSF
jgi:hypothetical protein